MKNKNNSSTQSTSPIPRLGPAGFRANRYSVASLFIVGLYVLLIPLTGFAGSAPLKRFDLPETESIAEVNGQQLSLERFNALWAVRAKPHRLEDGRIPDSQAIELKRGLVEELIDEMLIEQAAEQAQIRVDSQQVDEALEVYKAQFPSPESFEEHVKLLPFGLSGLRKQLHLKQLRERVVELGMSPAPTENQLRLFYEGEPKRFRMPSHVVAMEILLKVQPGISADSVRAKRQLAESLRQQAQQPNTSFEELVKQNSEDVNAARNGLQGELRPHDIAPEIWSVLARLQPGNISPVIRTEKGFHVLKLVSHGPIALLPFTELKPAIAVEMKAIGRDLRRTNLSRQLRANAVIINTLAERYTSPSREDSSSGASIRPDVRPARRPVLKTDALSRPR